MCRRRSRCCRNLFREAGELDRAHPLTPQTTVDGEVHSSSFTKADSHSTNTPCSTITARSSTLYPTCGTWGRHSAQFWSKFMRIYQSTSKSSLCTLSIQFASSVRRCLASEAPPPRRPRGASSPAPCKHPCNKILWHKVTKLAELLDPRRILLRSLFARSPSGRWSNCRITA